MCLQYGIWALSASGHLKYDHYAEAFYKRARQYMEADEMKVSLPFYPLEISGTLYVLIRQHRVMASTLLRYITPKHGPSLPATRRKPCCLPEHL